MALEPPPEFSPSATACGEKVSISQRILRRLDNIQHNQDGMQQDIHGLRPEMRAVRQARPDHDQLAARDDESPG